jgi:hypothetical protein
MASHWSHPPVCITYVYSILRAAWLLNWSLKVKLRNKCPKNAFGSIRGQLQNPIVFIIRVENSYNLYKITWLHLPGGSMRTGP